LHDHNAVSSLDEAQQTFNCLLNCQRINRVYHTLCQIEGNLRVGRLGFACWLLDQSRLVHGQWQYQRVELTRFAFRYNERAHRNFLLKTNPLDGSVVATQAFFSGGGLFEEEGRLRELLTDLVHGLGEESEMVFNTMLEIILGQEANEPYLKSAIKVSPGFPRYMKVEKLLDKVKSLIATSSFYKIRSDISSAHKNRSYFKKMYLNQDKKMVYNPRVIQMALLYEPKFSHRYEECSKKPKERALHFIKDYIELEEKN
jgi:hypothetical protein